MEVKGKNLVLRRFKHIVCIGYYVPLPDGQCSIMSKTAASRTPEAKKNLTLTSFQRLAEDSAIEDALFVFLNDVSPYGVDHEEVFERVGSRPVFSIRLTKNQGVAGKENIFNALSVEFAENLIRVDSDVIVKDSFVHVLSGLESIEKVGVLTAGCGRMRYYVLAEFPCIEFVDTKMVGNVWISPSKVFSEVSMNDPEVGHFHDKDLLFKILAAGYRSVMSSQTVVAHARSGGGASLDRRRRDANAFARRNPLVTISYVGDFPRCYYTPQNTGGFFKRKPLKIGPTRTAKMVIKKMRKALEDV